MKKIFLISCNLTKKEQFNKQVWLQIIHENFFNSVQLIYFSILIPYLQVKLPYLLSWFMHFYNRNTVASIGSQLIIYLSTLTQSILHNFSKGAMLQGARLEYLLSVACLASFPGEHIFRWRHLEIKSELGVKHNNQPTKMFRSSVRSTFYIHVETCSLTEDTSG